MNQELSEIGIKFSTRNLPFEYKWLEFRLIVNKQLYDEEVIDFQVFKAMEESLLSRMTKIRNESSESSKSHEQSGNIHAS